MRSVAAELLSATYSQKINCYQKTFRPERDFTICISLSDSPHLCHTYHPRALLTLRKAFQIHVSISRNLLSSFELDFSSFFQFKSMQQEVFLLSILPNAEA